MKRGLKTFFLTLCLLPSVSFHAQIINVGSGSYTTTYPGADVAGRNSYPSGSPQLSGNALGKPVPTNDWWSSLIKENHVSNLFTNPYTLKTVSAGLVVSYIPQGVIDDLLPITVGVSGLSASQATVSDYSDWLVTMRWNDGTHQFEATAGIAMPFLYFNKNSSDVAQITVTSGTVTVSNELLIIENAKNGADFAVYAPIGSIWSQTGNTYTSTLNGQNYWSMAFLPPSATNLSVVAEAYKQYAYVFPTNTTATYSYNQETSVVRTVFHVTTAVKEGSHTNMLLGLLPHQWGHLASDSPLPTGYNYRSIRGEIKTLSGNDFYVENKFYGILPTLPYVDTLSAGFSATSLTGKIDAIKNDQLALWTDSYNEGQVLNRLIQTARVAAEMGNTAACNLIVNTVKDRLENWLKAETGEVAFLFYYNATWSALLGYPAGHGQDSNLNDHHFHWGYFIHAAAFVEQYQPGWAAQWGNMINLLVRDAASNNRNDNMFPYLRNFSPYAGHCWANGFATFPQGNDQESTSESMQFNSSLIHWGTITNNNAIRDLGIYLYTTEQTAIEEYWFDVNRQNFGTNQNYALVSRIWGNSYDNGTFWTNDIAASYGIELYPIHGGSLYLGHNQNYIKRLWNEIKANTGITTNQANDNLWHDVMWEFAAFINPSEALAMYDSYPNRSLKFGITDAQTYHWLHAMNVLGKVSSSITANHPIAAVFDLNGRITYVAQNYSAVPIVVTFSDGFQLPVPAYKLVTQSVGVMLPSVTITTPDNNAKLAAGQSVSIKASADDMSGYQITRVDFYANNVLINSDNSVPYEITWTPSVGNYVLVAKAINSNGDIGTSESISVSVTTDTSCSQTSNEASQGSFSTGYHISFETTGTSVIVESELLDADKQGVIAYLWQNNPFSENQMQSSGTQKFTGTLQNQTIGTTLQLAVKFAFAGGMSVTKYFNYVVGNNCEVSSLIPNQVVADCKIYPNPAHNQLYIESSQPISEVDCYDLVGNKMDVYVSNSSTVTLEIGHLPVGLYLIQIRTKDGSISTQKLIKR